MTTGVSAVIVEINFKNITTMIFNEQGFLDIDEMIAQEPTFQKIMEDGVVTDQELRQQTIEHDFSAYVEALEDTELIEKAAELYQRAADQGDALAQAHLGLLYEFGDGVDLSYEKALEYFRMSADQGNSIGQWGMGQMYQFGLGVEPSYQKAAEYYQLSADQNDPDGLECLGYLYLEGLGVEQSTDRAMELYRRAAALGSEEAQRQLAILGDGK